MQDLELFTVSDLESLGKPQLAAGAFVTLPGGSRARVVAPDTLRPAHGRWWLVKLVSGRVVSASADQLVLS